MKLLRNMYYFFAGAISVLFLFFAVLTVIDTGWYPSLIFLVVSLTTLVGIYLVWRYSRCEQKK